MRKAAPPAPALVVKPLDSQVDVHGLTHPGLKRPSNQDHFLICSLRKQLEVHATSLASTRLLQEGTDRLAFLAMVADGVGGSAGGEEASGAALETVTSYLTHSTHCYYTADPSNDHDFIEALEGAALRSHEELVSRAARDGRRSGATTLTLFMSVWPRIYLLQVGDSRYYQLRDGELTQVSRDQTMAQELIDRGVITPSDRAAERLAHTLSSSLGGPQSAPTVVGVDNDWGVVHLLCSDGLTKHVSDAQIRDRLLAMTSARQVAEALLQDALDGGGSDNITIVVGRAVRP